MRRCGDSVRADKELLTLKGLLMRISGGNRMLFGQDTGHPATPSSSEAGISADMQAWTCDMTGMGFRVARVQHPMCSGCSATGR